MIEKIKPHLLMLLTQDLQSPSGLGRYFPLAKYLVREGFQVSILALHPDFANFQERAFNQEGVKVRYVAQMHVHKYGNKTHYFSSTKLVSTSIKAMRALYREGVKENADLIFVGKPHPMNGLAGLWLTRREDLPLIVDCDDYESESNRTNAKWQKKVLAYFENYLPKKANLVTTNTYFMQDHLILQGVEEKKIVYLPNGVDTERFREPSPDKVAQLRQELSLDGKRVIGYYGSLNLANHPVDLLIRSFKLVTEKIDEVILLIVGGGKDLDHLKKLSEELGLKDKVIFTGRVKPDEMNVYYRLAEVSVDPVNDTLADRGRCPLKIFESWQMGVPVVTSDVGDRKILAGSPSAALLAKSGDEITMTEQIINALSDDFLLLNLSKRAKFRSLSFSWAVLAKRAKEKINSLSFE
jgi:glycosyltransferase involved in cell wall biosynthesis